MIDEKCRKNWRVLKVKTKQGHGSCELSGKPNAKNPGGIETRELLPNALMYVKGDT
jgi:hypothetical protein